MNLNKILIALLFLSLSFGQLQRLGQFYLHDLILLLLLLVNRRRLRVFRPVLWFGLAGLISLVIAAFKLPASEVLIGSLYLLRFLAYSLLLNLKIDRRYLLFFSGAVAVFGLAQYLLIPDTRFLAALNWDDHYYRLISTLLDPNFTGIILVLGLILIFLKKPLSWPLLVLHLSALLLTYSRSSYLALAIAGLFWALISKKLKWFFLSLAVLTVVLLALPRPGGEGVKLERWFSIEQRLDNYSEGISLWQKSPVFGLGFNTLRSYRGDLVSHAASGLDSSLLFVLATTGAVGLIAYLNLLRSLWQKNLLLRLSLVGLLVHSLFVNSLFYPFVMIWLFSLASLDKRKT